MTKSKSSKGTGKRISNPLFILLDLDKKWRNQLGANRAVVCKRQRDIFNVLPRATIDSMWISSGPKMTDEFLRVLSRSDTKPEETRHRLGNFLMLQSPRPKTIPFLRSLFGNLVGDSPAFKLLPSKQLCAVLAGTAEDARDVFIGGVVDTEFGLLTLVRGNLDRITVPLSIFHPSGTSKPDFRRFELDDYGHTLRFGEYEASAHFVLYEAAADYRKRMDVTRRAEDKGFGPSLRRLRAQKGIARHEFTGISAKTIARLERGEVGKPHGTTMGVIAKTLGVRPEEIESY